MTCCEQRHYMQKQFSHFTVNQINKYYFYVKQKQFSSVSLWLCFCLFAAWTIFPNYFKETNFIFTLSILQDSFRVNKTSLTLFLGKMKGSGPGRGHKRPGGLLL